MGCLHIILSPLKSKGGVRSAVLNRGARIWYCIVDCCAKLFLVVTRRMLGKSMDQPDEVLPILLVVS